MKFKSKFWKDRSLHLPGIDKAVAFDKNGECEINVDDKQAEYIVKNCQGLSIVEEDGSERKTKTEEVVNGQAPLANGEEIKQNQEELDKENAIKQAKQEATDKINAIKKLADLKELANSFPEDEWKEFTTIAQFKTYLISKI